MADELSIVLRLVADGRISPGEAAPLIEALGREPAAREDPAPVPALRRTGNDPRRLRIRVKERGRQVVNLQIPLTFADTALRMVPGLSSEQGSRIRAAIATGTAGTILDIEDEDGDGVLITTE